METIRTYLGLGSNMGNREQFIQDAINQLKNIGVVDKISPFYITKPVGFESTTDFINCCVAFNTTFTPEELLLALQSIERSLGRTKKSRNKQHTSRKIDIDILLYGDLEYRAANLIIPHPEMTDRMFVLKPLNDIASDVFLPGTNKRIKELLAALTLKEKSST